MQLVEDCFFEVLDVHRRKNAYTAYRQHAFEHLLKQEGIQRPNNNNMSNIFKYLHQYMQFP